MDRETGFFYIHQVITPSFHSVVSSSTCGGFGYSGLRPS